MSSVVTAPRRAASRQGWGTAFDRARRLGVRGDATLGFGLAAGLALVAFIATGGVDLAPNTWVQVALVLTGAALALAVLLFGAPGRAWGAGALLAFGALAALTFASIAWSVQPETSWLEANRTLSYLAAFGAAIALARLVPARWRAMVGALATAATVISAYALLVKVFPSALDPNDPLGRLQAPFDYWNAVGVMAAMGIPGCLWAGARRERAPFLRTLSVPAIAILIAALMLSYSRGALAAAIIGTALWFALVPLRLRAALVLGAGVAGGTAITAWAFSTHAISGDKVAESARASAGHAFGLVLVVVLVLTALAGFVAAFALDSIVVPAPVRRRLGAALIGLVALFPVGGVVALASSSRGLTGEVSHIWDTLTSTSGGVGSQPGRLVQLSNSRPVYWREGLAVGEHHLLAGSGALGFATASARYSTYANIQHAHVDHAHSYLVETFADFGLIGLAVSLALLIAWWLAARRCLELSWPRRGPGSLRAPPKAPPDSAQVAERAGLLTLFAVVLIFGLHSLIDWTWFIPGTAVAAIACAGWLAGRGPLAAPVGRRANRRLLSRSPRTGLLAASVVIVAVAASWVIVQPLSSTDALSASENAAIRGNAAVALTDARQAAASDPVSVEPLFVESALYSALGKQAAAHRERVEAANFAAIARRELVKAVQLQPANPETWQQLGSYDLVQGHAREALSELQHANLLDHDSFQLDGLVNQARAALASKT